MIRCKVCSVMKHCEKLFVPKLDGLQKHVGHIERPSMHILGCMWGSISWVLKLSMLRLKESLWVCLGNNQWVNKLLTWFILSENVNLCNSLWYFISWIKSDWWQTLEAWKIHSTSFKCPTSYANIGLILMGEYDKVYEQCVFAIHTHGNTKCLVHHYELWQSRHYQLPKLGKYACVSGRNVETYFNLTTSIVGCEWYFCT
jgi:hypothetical protein